MENENGRHGNMRILGLAAGLMLLAGSAWAQGDVINRVGKALDALGGNAPTGQDQQRSDQALNMCREHALQLVRNAGGRGVSIEHVDRVDVQGDRAEVQADMRGQYDRRETTGRVNCWVNFSGRDRVTQFDDNGLVTANLNGDRSGDRDEAVTACSQEARDHGYDVRQAQVSGENSRDVTVALRLRRQGNSVQTDCRYSKDSQQARFSGQN